MIDNPHVIEARIQELDRKLDIAVQETAKRAETHAVADATYKSAYAQAVLKIRDAERHLPRNERATVDEVAARAALETQAEYRAFVHAEALLKSVQEAARTRRSQMEGQRTLAANVRFLIDQSAA